MRLLWHSYTVTFTLRNFKRSERVKVGKGRWKDKQRLSCPVNYTYGGLKSSYMLRMFFNVATVASSRARTTCSNSI